MTAQLQHKYYAMWMVALQVNKLLSALKAALNGLVWIRRDTAATVCRKRFEACA
jgi:hypothetical protein